MDDQNFSKDTKNPFDDMLTGGMMDFPLDDLSDGIFGVEPSKPFETQKDSIFGDDLFNFDTNNDSFSVNMPIKNDIAQDIVDPYNFIQDPMACSENVNIQISDDDKPNMESKKAMPFNFDFSPIARSHVPEYNPKVFKTSNDSNLLSCAELEERNSEIYQAMNKSRSFCEINTENGPSKTPIEPYESNQLLNFFISYNKAFRKNIDSNYQEANGDDLNNFNHLNSCVNDTCKLIPCARVRFLINHFFDCSEEDCSICKSLTSCCRPLSAKLELEYNKFHKIMESRDSLASKFFIKIGKFFTPKGTLPSVPASIIDEPDHLEETQIPTTEKHEITTKIPTNLDKIQIVEKPYNPEDIYTTWYPIISQLYNSAECYFFAEPVDPIKLGIPDYFDIIREPMDIGTIFRKLSKRQYTSPWEIIYDVNLVFDNAYLYNKKNTKVHKFASKLSSRFESFSVPTMRTLGYCCNRRYVYSLKSIYCNSKDFCVIRPNAMYYRNGDIIFCLNCFDNTKSSSIEVNLENSNEPTMMEKSLFSKQRNNVTEYEPFIVCCVCLKKFHKVCVMHVDNINGQFFYCDPCFKLFGIPRIENKFISRLMPKTQLSDYIERSVNTFLRSECKDCAYVNIRVICNVDKYIETRENISKRFGHLYHKRYPYKSKAIFAFQEVKDMEVCFFSLHVQEYGSNSPQPNTRRVNISYLDSVHYFQPKHLKTLLYHEIMLSYINFCKNKGFLYCHIWSCPPCEGDDYIFHCHSFEQKLPKPRRLLEWYNKIIEIGVNRGIIAESQDIHKYFQNFNIQKELVLHIPYFEGDYWSNSLDDIINDFEKERRNLNDPVSKKHESARKNNRKVIASPKRAEEYTLNQKLLTLMDRYREVFFVLKLNDESTPFAEDQEPIFPSDLMDGRSGFLTLCRDNNWEFSSYRHALYSTKATMYMVHQQMFNFTEYCCDKCKAVLHTGYHCSQCKNSYDLCDVCYFRFAHEHPMSRKEYIEFKLDNAQQEIVNMDQFIQSVDLQHMTTPEFKNVYARFVGVLQHATFCTDDVCSIAGCERIKYAITHFAHCPKVDRSKCDLCSRLFILYYTHSFSCTVARCQFPYCARLRSILSQNRASRPSKTRSRIHNMAEHMNKVACELEIKGDHKTDKSIPIEQNSMILSQTPSINASNLQHTDFSKLVESRSNGSSQNDMKAKPNNSYKYVRTSNLKAKNTKIRSASAASRNNNNQLDMTELVSNQSDQNQVSLPRQSSVVLTANSAQPSSNNPVQMEIAQQDLLRRSFQQSNLQNNSMLQIDIPTAIRLGLVPPNYNPSGQHIIVNQNQLNSHQLNYLNQLNQLQNMRIVANIQQQQKHQQLQQQQQQQIQAQQIQLQQLQSQQMQQQQIQHIQQQLQQRQLINMNMNQLQNQNRVLSNVPVRPQVVPTVLDVNSLPPNIVAQMLENSKHQNMGIPQQMDALRSATNMIPQGVDLNRMNMTMQPQMLDQSRLINNIQPQTIVDPTRISSNIQGQMVDVSRILPNLQSQMMDYSRMTSNVQPQIIDPKMFTNVQLQGVDSTRSLNNMQTSSFDLARLPVAMQTQLLEQYRAQNNVQAQTIDHLRLQNSIQSKGFDLSRLSNNIQNQFIEAVRMPSTIQSPSMEQIRSINSIPAKLIDGNRLPISLQSQLMDPNKLSQHVLNQGYDFNKQTLGMMGSTLNQQKIEVHSPNKSNQPFIPSPQSSQVISQKPFLSNESSGLQNLTKKSMSSASMEQQHDDQQNISMFYPQMGLSHSTNDIPSILTLSNSNQLPTCPLRRSPSPYGSYEQPVLPNLNLPPLTKSFLTIKPSNDTGQSSRPGGNTIPPKFQYK